MYLKDDRDRYFNNHGKLKNYLESKDKKLVFAMNGGMYLKDFYPQGLYIEDGGRWQILNNKKSNYGNFYLRPNGVFYITYKDSAYIERTKNI